MTKVSNFDNIELGKENETSYKSVSLEDEIIDIKKKKWEVEMMATTAYSISVKSETTEETNSTKTFNDVTNNESSVTIALATSYLFLTTNTPVSVTKGDKTTWNLA